jgi:ribosomal protein L11 methyltransferase
VPTGSWLALCCRVAAADYAALEAALEEAGALSVTCSEGDSDVFAEPGLAGQAEWQAFAVQALFAEDADAARIIADVEAACGRAVHFETSIVPDAPWVEQWQAAWQPRQFAGGLWVCPSWSAPPAGARHVLYLDPGRAFGTGTHETTALCLDWLGMEADVGGRHVVDYGCGSGILALAAHALGARRVTAVDIDPEALAVARENAGRNGVTGIDFGDPGRVAAGVADVLVANILMEPLLGLAPRFAELLPSRARIALSGILTTQVARILDAYGEAFTMEPARCRGDWALLIGRRR